MISFVTLAFVLIFFVIFVMSILNPQHLQFEHFYEFRVPSSLNRTVLLQLSDKSIDKYYQNNTIITPPYEPVMCK